MLFNNGFELNLLVCVEKLKKKFNIFSNFPMKIWHFRVCIVYKNAAVPLHTCCVKNQVMVLLFGTLNIFKTHEVLF